MVKILFGNDSVFQKARVEKFETQSGSIGIRLCGDIPKSIVGFKIFANNGTTLIEDCASYDTIYRVIDNAVEFCNDKFPYVEPEIVVPEPIVIPEPTEEEKAEIEKQNRIAEINSQISMLENSFTETTDYKTIKNIQAEKMGKELEYSWEEINNEAEAIREQIHVLENELATLLQ